MRTWSSIVVMLGALAASASAFAIACGTFDEGDEPAAPAAAKPDGSSDDGSPSGGDDANTNVDPDAAASECQPPACAVIGSSDGRVMSVVSDFTRVYWMTSDKGFAGDLGSLYSCMKNGCATATPIVSNEQVGALGSDGTTAYASFAYGFKRTVRLGDGLTTIGALNGFGAVFQLFPRSDGLYFNSWYEEEGPRQGARTIRRWTSGSDSEYLGSFYTAPVDAGGETVNTGPATLTKDHAVLGAINTGRVIYCKFGDCDTWYVLARTDDGVISMTSTNGDEEIVVWVDIAGRVNKCGISQMPNGECSPSQILGKANLEEASPQTVFWTAGVLYVMTSNDDLFSCSLDDCAASLKKIIHLSGLTPKHPWVLSGRTIFVDGESIYLGLSPDPGRSTIVKLPR